MRPHPQAVRFAHTAREVGDGARRHGKAEQADGRAAGHVGQDREGASGKRDGEDAGRLVAGSRTHGRRDRPRR